MKLVEFPGEEKITHFLNEIPNIGSSVLSLEYIISNDLDIHENPALIEQVYNKEFPVFKYLINKNGLGRQTLLFLKRIEESETALSDDDLTDELFNIDTLRGKNFANYQLAEREGLNSQMMIALVDEGVFPVRVFGVMKVFSKWHEPLFAFKKNEVISMVKEVTKKLAEIRAKEAADIYQDKLRELLKANSHWNLETIQTGEQYLAKFKKAKNRVHDYQSIIPFEEIEDELGFQKNCQSNIILNKIRIRNIYFFGDTEWSFDPKINILVGKNGYGKSYLFRLILAIIQQNEEAIRGFLKLEDELNPPNIQITLDRKPSNGQNEKLILTRNKK